MNAVQPPPDFQTARQSEKRSLYPLPKDGFVSTPLTQEQRNALGIDAYYRPYRLNSDVLKSTAHYASTVKRLMDILLSLVGILFLWPLMLVFMLAVVLEDPKGSPLFMQERIGKNGKPFKMYKLRSMYTDAEEHLPEMMEQNEAQLKAFKIKKDPRITRVGAIARKFSIDELFQLINILKADMSIVGPRPPLAREVSQYDEYDLQRLAIRPGLTCYWQVYPHRHEISFEDWVAMDLKYLNNRSLKTDVELILRTFLTIFSGNGD